MIDTDLLLGDLIKHRDRLTTDARTARIGITDLLSSLVASPEDIAEQALRYVAAAARVSVANTAITTAVDYAPADVLEHIKLAYASSEPSKNPVVEQRRRDGYLAEIEALALFLDR